MPRICIHKAHNPLILRARNEDRDLLEYPDNNATRFKRKQITRFNDYLTWRCCRLRSVRAGPRTVALAGEVADGVLLDSVTDPATVRRARGTVDDARAAAGREGRARVTAYTEVDPAADRLPERVADRVGSLHEAGADAVVLQGTGERPDPRPLVDALAEARLLP